MNKVFVLFFFCAALVVVSVSAVAKKCEPSSCPIKCCDQKNVCAKVVSDCREFAACSTDGDCNHTGLYCNEDRCSPKSTKALLSEIEFLVSKRNMEQLDEPLRLVDVDTLSNSAFNPLDLLAESANAVAQDSTIIVKEDANQSNMVLEKSRTSNPVSNWSTEFRNHSHKASRPAKPANATFNVTDPQKIVSKWVFDKEKKVFVWTFSNKETNQTQTFETNSSSLSFVPKAPLTNTSQYFRNHVNHHDYNISKDSSKNLEHRHHKDKDHERGGPKKESDFEDEELYQRNGSESKHHKHHGHHKGKHHEHHGKHHGSHHGHHGKHHKGHQEHHGKHHGDHHEHHGKHHGGHHGKHHQDHHERHGKHHGGHHEPHEGRHHGHHESRHHGHHGHHGHHKLHRASFLLWTLLGVAVTGVFIFVICKACRKAGHPGRMAERIAHHRARLLNRLARSRDNKVSAEMATMTTTNNRVGPATSDVQTNTNPPLKTEENLEFFQNEAPTMNTQHQAAHIPQGPHYYAIQSASQALPQTHPQFMHYQAPAFQPLPQQYIPQYYPMHFPQNMHPMAPRYPMNVPVQDHSKNGKRPTNNQINLEL